MTKNYFNPATVWFKNLETGKMTKSAPELRTRHNRGACFKTGAAGGGDDDDARQELLRKVKETTLQALQERGATPELMASLKPITEEWAKLPLVALREMADEKTGVIAMVKAQGEALAELKTQLDAQPEDMSVRSQCKAYLEANKDAIVKIRNRQKVDLPSLELQLRDVANPMLPSTVMPNGSLHITRFEIEKPVNAPFEAPFTLWNYLKKGNTTAETYIWVNRLPREGNAAFIAPGVYKPNVSFTIDSDSSFAKKVAASEKMATELLQDIDGFSDWVESELRAAVMKEANTKVSTGTSSNTSPAGIRTLSVVFTNPGLKVENPNYWDAIKAGVTMLKAQDRFASRAVAVFINPVDKANADMTKATTQGQLFVPFTINATIVEDSSIPVGYVQFVVLDAYRILMYKQFYMNWGWENDDFTKNLLTVVGEMRFHQFVKDSDAGFAVYDTFDNIINAIREV